LLGRLGKGSTLPEEDLKRIIDLANEHGKLVNWWILGQPAPDVVVGSIVTPISSAGPVVTGLLGLSATRLSLDVFPLGIPFPDEALVEFRSQTGAEG
jgi:hypothetical protein